MKIFADRMDGASSRALRKPNRQSQRRSAPVIRAAAAVSEILESRTLLSGSSSLVVPAGITATPDYLTAAGATPAGSSSPSGLSPTQLRDAYGLGAYGSSSVTFNGIQGDGTGQTIAIVVAYHDPTALSDLNAFSKYYGLPTLAAGAGGASGPGFQQLPQSGDAALPPVDPAGPGQDWEIEESLDIEWAHAFAPRANIAVIECDDSGAGLYYGDIAAGQLNGVVVVNNSWTEDEYSSETINDFVFTTPYGHLGGSATAGGTDLAGGITFTAAAGDHGAYGDPADGEATQITPQYPAASPNVVSVGGTRLTVSGTGYSSETAWGNGAASGTELGGGGGISQYEAQPSWQAADAKTDSTTNRVYPDISAEADPNAPSGAGSIFDSYDFGAATPWADYGGTSLACPIVSGLIAVTDQGRAVHGFGSLDGASQTLPRLYSLAGSAYHDITAGNNGYAAGVGFDLAAGLGSPQANVLVPQLAAAPALGAVSSAARLSFSTAPSSTVAGATLSSISVRILGASGSLDSADNSFVTLSVGADPGGAHLLGATTVQAQSGIATFTGLSFDAASAGVTLIATDGALSVSSTAFNVASNATTTAVSAASGVYGQSGGFTLSAHVASNTALAVSGGSVTFTIWQGKNVWKTVTSSPVVAGAATASLAAALMPAGSYTVTGVYTSTAASPSFAQSAASAAAPFVIAKAALTVLANNASRTYGATNPHLFYSFSGLRNGDLASGIGGAPVESTTATAASTIGAYPITLSAGTLSAANYTLTFLPGILTVNRALLKVTASSATRVYGSPNPTLTSQITGFVNGQNASVVSGKPGLFTTAAASAGVGTYVIGSSLGTLSAANYVFALVYGTLTVKPATLSVAAQNALTVVGAPLPTLTDAITGFVNGDAASVVKGSPLLSTTAIAASPAGTYSITAGAGTLSAANYVFVFTPANLMIQPAGVLSVGALSASADPITLGATFSLSATSVTDTNPGAVVTAVDFYRDSNGSPGLQIGGDALLGAATLGSSGTWTLAGIATASLSPGIYTFYAVAIDSYKVASSAVSVSETMSSSTSLVASATPTKASAMALLIT